MIQDNRGHIVVELAVIFPLIAMIAFAFIMYMHGIALQVGMGVAAREGARDYARTHYDVSAIERTENTLKTYGVDEYNVEIIRDGRYMGVSVKKDYKVFVPLLGNQTFHLNRSYVFYPNSLAE